ncbi:MAG: hypothetical protein VB858_03630, partial [Planctomycetaceae bacterium]
MSWKLPLARILKRSMLTICAITLAGVSAWTQEPAQPESHPNFSVPDFSAATITDDGHPVGTAEPHDSYQGHLYADQYGWYPPEEQGSRAWQATESITHLIETPAETLRRFSEQMFCLSRFEFATELSDVPIGIVETPVRPDLLFEYNDGFLKPGPIGAEYTTPHGAVWRPSVWVYGQYRTQFAARNDPGVRRFTELAHRLNIFGQLNLTGTERVILGMRPLDEEIHRPNGRLGREFNGYDFQEGDRIDGWNDEVQTLFFEGDFGELFPNLDPWDSRRLDYGFTVGRQAMIAQQGLLINDDMLD